MADIIVGIDLGTTNSEVAVLKDGKIEIVEIDGSRLLPSCAGVGPDGKILVGAPALNQYALRPDHTVRSIKRKMGSAEKVRLGDSEYTPVEISAMILRKLKESAEKFLGQPVGKAVITVPAQFSDAQRQATREAGEVAGLEVVRIINEPTAACLGYEDGKSHRRNLLAFDLGGGTFDVSVVRCEDQVVEVVASSGDNHLGGDDMDALLATHVSNDIYAKQKAPARLSLISERRILRAAERVKHQLSDMPFARLIEENLAAEGAGVPESADMEISRTEFNAMISPLTEKMTLCVHKAIADAGLTVRDIDDVIMVGGATRVPEVQDTVEKLTGKRPLLNIHPDLAVAYGAGVMAARLSGARQQKLLIDITPCTFGTSALGFVGNDYGPHRFYPVIKAGTPLPVSRAEVFYTCCDGQEAVLVDVFEGEDPDSRNNTHIGGFKIEGLDESQPEGSEIICHMSLDLDGILHVTATEKCSGLSKKISIENSLAKMSGSDIKKAKDKISGLFGAAAEPPPPAAAAGVYDKMLARVKAVDAKMDEADRKDVNEFLERLKEAAAAGDNAKTEDLSGKIEDIIFYLES
jgi:molecular chaperone DnaK (HSP70)